MVMAAQCKPNHESIISYLYQMNGLVDNAGVPHVNYSTGVNGLTSAGTVVETGLFDDDCLEMREIREDLDVQDWRGGIRATIPPVEAVVEKRLALGPSAQ